MIISYLEAPHKRRPTRHRLLAWLQQQAEFLRQGRFAELDVEHLSEELESMGASDKRELASRLTVLLTHLLKWQCQAERRGVSWRLTIAEQRRAIRRQPQPEAFSPAIHRKRIP